MDQQLACATFATLIPVLMIAGYFSSDGLSHWTTTRFLYVSLWAYLTLDLLGEAAAIFGTVPGFIGPEHLYVLLSGCGAANALSGLGIAFIAAAVRARRQQFVNRGGGRHPGKSQRKR